MWLNPSSSIVMQQDQQSEECQITLQEAINMINVEAYEEIMVFIGNYEEMIVSISNYKEMMISIGNHGKMIVDDDL